MNANCCCGCLFTFPCCGPCWFPVPQDESLINIPNPIDPNFGTVVGGTVTITDFHLRTEYNDITPGYYWEYTQTDVSEFDVFKRRCYEDAAQQILGDDYFWYFLSCQWRVPCELIIDYQDGNGPVSQGLVIQRVLFTPDGWRHVNYNGLGSPGIEPMNLGDCSGSFLQVGPTVPGGFGQSTVSYTASGGLSLPSGFECGFNGLLVRTGSTTPFRGTRSTFPPEFFPSGL